MFGEHQEICSRVPLGHTQAPLPKQSGQQKPPNQGPRNTATGLDWSSHSWASNCLILLICFGTLLCTPIQKLLSCPTLHKWPNYTPYCLAPGPSALRHERTACTLITPPSERWEWGGRGCPKITGGNGKGTLIAPGSTPRRLTGHSKNLSANT